MKDIQVRMIDKQSGQVVLEWKLENNDWNWEKIKEQNYYKQNKDNENKK